MKRTRNAFTLIEMLIVIAIISILAAMAISSFSNAAQDSREVLVRQQLATIQEAVNNWASRQIGKVVPDATAGPPAVTSPNFGPNPRTIEQVRGIYNGKNAPSRFGLFSGYLDTATLESISPPNDTTGRFTTDAMRQTGYYLTLPNWDAGSYPKVQFNP